MQKDLIENRQMLMLMIQHLISYIISPLNHMQIGHWGSPTRYTTAAQNIVNNISIYTV